MESVSDSVAKKCKERLNTVRKEISRVIVGQSKAVEGMLKALLSNGHVLVEGIPGVAKTLLIRTLAKTTGCEFRRIQFTPDLLPTDIVGITSYEEQKGFFVIKGPIFSNFVLADEINRAPPKVQSALLEAMAERQATIGKETFPLEEPFFVLATQNPIETLGTYTLPEAQVDRFLFKLSMGYPSRDDEKVILVQNATLKKFEKFEVKNVLTSDDIIEMQRITKNVSHGEKIKDYIVDIIQATRYPDKFNIKLGKYIELGASPRATINLFIASKADALLRGDNYIKPQHVKNIAHDVLRHRIILNYTGQAESISVEDIISEVLARVPIP